MLNWAMSLVIPAIRDEVAVNHRNSHLWDPTFHSAWHSFGQSPLCAMLTFSIQPPLELNAMFRSN